MIKTEHPFEGNEDWIKTYTNEEGKVLLQVETNIVYGKGVIDVYPCAYTYVEIDKPVDEDVDIDNAEENNDA